MRRGGQGKALHSKVLKDLFWHGQAMSQGHRLQLAPARDSQNPPELMASKAEWWAECLESQRSADSHLEQGVGEGGESQQQQQQLCSWQPLGLTLGACPLVLQQRVKWTVGLP